MMLFLRMLDEMQVPVVQNDPKNTKCEDMSLLLAQFWWGELF